jgi:hypothetical protein
MGENTVSNVEIYCQILVSKSGFDGDTDGGEGKAFCFVCIGAKKGKLSGPGLQPCSQTKSCSHHTASIITHSPDAIVLATTSLKTLTCTLGA